MPVQGRLDAQVAAESIGQTLEGAVRSAHVSAVVSMAGGSISRDAVEKTSTDLRQLFRTPKGMTPVTCLLGDRGRDAHHCAPPAQNRTGGIPAYGSHLGCLTANR